MPLSDEGSEFVRGEVETVEVGQAVLALNLVDTELDLAESVVLILLEIRQRNLENSALQRIVCVLETGGSVDKSLSDTASSVRYMRILFVEGNSYSRIWKEDGAWQTVSSRNTNEGPWTRIP